nr:T9SS type A sorting domain-containing protein [Bacteroidota bacterium]
FSHSGFFFAWSDGDGSYSFDELVPDWSYHFNVFQNEYYYGDQIDLTIDPTGPQEIIMDFYLEPKDGITVSGQLFNVETNEPILMANRTVRITAINSMWAETNENGEFTFVNVQPGYYANITVTSEDTAYIKCTESTIYDFIVPEGGLSGVQLFQKKFETVHVVTIDDNSFLPGEIKTLRFSLVLDDLRYGEIWGVELHLSPNITALSTTPFRKYTNNNLVFEREFDCSYPDRLVWEGYHSVYGLGNVGNLQALNDSVYADVEFQFNDNAIEEDAEIFYEVFYSYACVWQPFSFGTILLENANVAVGIDEVEETTGRISCFPNPASDKATIRLSLEEDIIGKIALFDITGQVILQPAEGLFEKGINEIILDTSGLSEGIYFYTFNSESRVFSGKLVISR